MVRGRLWDKLQLLCDCLHSLCHLAQRPAPQHITTKTLTLQVVGYVCVSISLVAMAVTIFVFIFLECKISTKLSKRRPLVYTMHNYIHIQLCATLAISQIIFYGWSWATFGDGAFGGWNPNWLSIGGCSSPLLVPNFLHVDADGGCGPLCGSGQAVKVYVLAIMFDIL